jgi:hypothetical protein
MPQPMRVRLGDCIPDQADCFALVAQYDSVILFLLHNIH